MNVQQGYRPPGAMHLDNNPQPRHMQVQEGYRPPGAQRLDNPQPNQLHQGLGLQTQRQREGHYRPRRRRADALSEALRHESERRLIAERRRSRNGRRYRN